MFIVDYDESGDDGYPPSSSPLFILSCVYLDHRGWKAAYEQITDFRRSLKSEYGLPVKMEFHTRSFLLNKDPYRKYGFPAHKRTEMVDKFWGFIGDLDIHIINVAINKPKLTAAKFDVLDTALKYSIQRIENHLNKLGYSDGYLIISDEGRIGKMRKTDRKIQRINLILSQFDGSTYRAKIKGLIEDPLGKDSKESYFIQLADLVSYITRLYCINKLGVASLPRRLPKTVDHSRIILWMDSLKNSLNLAASKHDQYGVVIHPK